MTPLDISLYSLLGATAAFAVIELGLAAAVTSFETGTQRVPVYNYYSGYSYQNVTVKAPPILIFMLFNASWTILVSAGALITPWFFGRKGAVTAKLNLVLGIVMSILYFVTMAFWLATFADIVTLLGGYPSDSDYLNAIIAFAVLLWLIFLVLFILTILALVGVLPSTWAGYQSNRGVRTEKSSPVEPSVPAHEVPMSTNPAVPSEMSSRDAEASYEQPTTAFSPSSPSAVHSAELSGSISPVYGYHGQNHA